MPVEDYAAQPFVQDNELFDFIRKICFSKLDGNYNGFSNVLTCTSSGKKTYLYFNNRDASLSLASKEDQAWHVYACKLPSCRYIYLYTLWNNICGQQTLVDT